MGIVEKNQLRSSRRAILIAANLLVFGLLSLTFYMRSGEEAERAVQRARAEALDVTNHLAEHITSKLNGVSRVGSSFAGAIALEPNIQQSDYSRFASTISLQDAGVVNIAAVRDMRVELVHPFDDNAQLIGRDLRDIPEQLSVAEEVQATGESVLQGPVRLMQGFDGFILRQPLYFNEASEQQIWGLLTIVFSAEGFFEDFRLEDVLSRYDIAIRSSRDGARVFGAAEVFAGDALVRSVAIPGGNWQIAIAPVAGWTGAFSNSAMLNAYLVTLVLALGLTNYLFRQREKNLRASEQLQAAIGVLADGFVLYDSDDRLVVCNEKYANLYNESKPAIVPGARFRDILQYGLDRGQYPDAIGREAEWLEARMAAYNAGDVTLEQQLSDGRWIRIREMPTPDGGRVGIRVDITQQVESRRRIEIAESRLRDAIDAVPAGFWLFDGDQRLEIVNARALEPFLQGAEPVALGETLEEVIDHLLRLEAPTASATDIASRRKQLMDLLGREFAEFEVEVGHDRWFRYFSQRTKEGGLVCFGVETTEVKRQEETLRRSNEQMRSVLRERDAAEARFAEVADISTEWFWEQDEDARLIYLSPGFGKATGVPPKEVLGKPRHNLALDKEGEHPLAILDKKVAAHEPFEDVIYPANISPGRELWFRTSGRPVFDDSGKFRGYIGTAADVTQLYTALREAKRADEAKTQFLNVISHELRTPITIVLGFNAFLKNLEYIPEFKRVRTAIGQSEDDTLAPAFEAAVQKVESFANKIDVAGEQLHKLIQDVLDLARIEASTLRVNLVPIEAGSIVASIIEQIEPLAEGKDIEFLSDVETMTLKTDEVRLRQVLINLLSNAVKYTDQGQVSVRAWRSRDDAVFEVEDTGLGIPGEALDRIFDRFTQVDASATRSQGGLGLGLTISRELITLLGGTIDASSSEGEGTRITFTLPLWLEEQAA